MKIEPFAPAWAAASPLLLLLLLLLGKVVVHEARQGAALDGHWNHFGGGQFVGKAHRNGDAQFAFAAPFIDAASRRDLGVIPANGHADGTLAASRVIGW